MLYSHGPVAPLPRLLKTPRDLALRAFFVLLATWPFVVAFIILQRLFF